MIKFDEKKQQKKLHELRVQEEEDFTRLLAIKYEMPYLNLSVMPINTDALRLIPEDDARAAGLAAFRLIGKELYIAISSPQKEKTKILLRDLEEKNYKLFLSMVSKKSLNRVWERYKEISYARETEPGVIDIEHGQISTSARELKTINDLVKFIKRELESKEKYRTSRLLEILIAGALATDASDLHIEPEKDTVQLRLRLDGVLQILLSFEFKIYSLLLSRIKLLSGLKLNIKKEPQDGRFSIKLKDSEIEIRTSVIPGAYGESIVLRILNPKTITVLLQELGIEKHLLTILEHEIKRPNGMILNTGPTGSGKTTTLYAFLRKIKTPKIKIITIEDPIEYHLPGITQTQVNEEKKYTFGEGLRAGLRQDPDVIMVGEIRDKDTAQTAINAALTGHLVLSTLHTNNAAGSIPRLIDLGINPKIISSALNIVIAQRLVRKLCKSCKIKGDPTQEEKKIIETILATLPKSAKLPVDHKYIWRPQGCGECNTTGYKGRTGIFEAILMDEAVEKLTRESPSERELKRAAKKQGILTIRQDGLIKVLQGITSLDELRRVIDLEEKVDFEIEKR